VDDDPSLPHVAIGGTVLHAETFGDSRAPMIVMLHGGPGGDYRSLLPYRALAADGYYVVLWDQRGAGLAGRVAGAVLSEPGAFTSDGLEDYLAKQMPPWDYTSEELNDLTWSDQFISPSGQGTPAERRHRAELAGEAPEGVLGEVGREPHRAVLHGGIDVQGRVLPGGRRRGQEEREGQGDEGAARPEYFLHVRVRTTRGILRRPEVAFSPMPAIVFAAHARASAPSKGPGAPARTAAARSSVAPARSSRKKPSPRRSPEGKRTRAEGRREAAESKRREAESRRASAEEWRANAEDLRKLAAGAVRSAETARRSADEVRRQRDQIAQTALELQRRMEAGRALAEQIREEAERLREASEDARRRAEFQRSHAEDSRTASEDARRLREDTREQRETLRRASERSRVASASGERSSAVDPELRRLVREEVRVALERIRRGLGDGREPPSPDPREH
jgi:hypothetical protein